MSVLSQIPVQPEARPKLQEYIPPATAKRVTETVYWEKYYQHESDVVYEWNDGVLEEKPMSSAFFRSPPATPAWIGYLHNLYL